MYLTNELKVIIKGDVNMKKLTNKTFKEVVMNDGHIQIEENLVYLVIQINDDNFENINEKFKEQLSEENKYNMWIGFITNELKDKYDIQSLPIYGDPNKYVTKWFASTPEKAIDSDLRNRSMQLLKRANDFITK